MTFLIKISFLVSTVFFALLMTWSPQHAQADPIEGSWRGSGIMKPSSGDKEKVRCKISCSKEAEKVFSFNATYAATSGNFSQYGEVNKVKGNRYIVTIYSSKNSATGRFRVVVNGSGQTINISSNKGSGRMNLRK